MAKIGGKRLYWIGLDRISRAGYDRVGLENIGLVREG